MGKLPWWRPDRANWTEGTGPLSLILGVLIFIALVLPAAIAIWRGANGY